MQVRFLPGVYNFQAVTGQRILVDTCRVDREGSGALEVAQALGTSMDSLVAVRLVSHHLRLIGVLNRGDEADTLILVDYDNKKG